MIAQVVEQKSRYESEVDAFELAADALALSADVRSALKHPERMLEISIPTVMDDGRIEHFRGCRAEHSTSLGPAQGGVLLHPGFSLDEAKAAAMWKTWQFGVLDLSCGGGQGGIAVNPARLSKSELERLTCGYALGVAPLVGTDQVLPSDDACARPQATSRGAFYAISAACQHRRIPLKGARVVVRGFGDMGSAAALLLEAARAAVVGASDSRGAVYNVSGLDIPSLMMHKRRSGSVVGFPHAEPITECELLALECDVFIPAALENAIHRQNAAVVRAALIAEMARGSVTPAADRILEEKGVFLIPDMLCNAGAAVVAYHERRQSHDGQDVYGKLERAIACGFQEVLAMSETHRVDMRRAATMVGVSRVAESIRVREFAAARV